AFGQSKPRALPWALVTLALRAVGARANLGCPFRAWTLGWLPSPRVLPWAELVAPFQGQRFKRNKSLVTQKVLAYRRRTERPKGPMLIEPRASPWVRDPITKNSEPC